MLRKLPTDEMISWFVSIIAFVLLATLLGWMLDSGCIANVDERDLTMWDFLR